MKQVKCNACKEKWYIDNQNEKKLRVCPFCATDIREKIELKNVNTLGEALCKAISDRGIEILDDRQNMYAYLLDTIPELKREIRIFSKSFGKECLVLYKEAFNKNENELELTMQQIKYLLIEEEGLSEEWTNKICKECRQALMYYRGESPRYIILADIVDVDLKLVEIKNRKIEDIKSHTVEKKKVGNKIYIKKIASEIDNYTICGRRKYGNKK